MQVHRIARDQYTYLFSADVPPVVAVDPGDRIVAETWDASTGRIRRPEDAAVYLRVRDPLKVNPAAGPIFVRGALPGDGIVVAVEAIRLTELGFVRVAPGVGLLQEGRSESRAMMVRVVGDELVFDGKLRCRARPMVGVIGTAPRDGVVYTGEPDPLGSNLDVNAIAVGSRVHLPVQVEGALLAIGDVHASMGDGEVSGTGVEIPAEVTVTVDVEKGPIWPHFWIENPAAWVTVAHAGSLDEAVRRAVAAMTGLVSLRLGVDSEEAFMLFSAVGDARVGQAAFCGIDVTAYAVFPVLNR